MAVQDAGAKTRLRHRGGVCSVTVWLDTKLPACKPGTSKLSVCRTLPGCSRLAIVLSCEENCARGSCAHINCNLGRADKLNLGVIHIKAKGDAWIRCNDLVNGIPQVGHDERHRKGVPRNDPTGGGRRPGDPVFVLEVAGPPIGRKRCSE